MLTKKGSFSSARRLRLTRDVLGSLSGDSTTSVSENSESRLTVRSLRSATTVPLDAYAQKASPSLVWAKSQQRIESVLWILDSEEQVDCRYRIISEGELVSRWGTLHFFVPAVGLHSSRDTAHSVKGKGKKVMIRLPFSPSALPAFYRVLCVLEFFAVVWIHQRKDITQCCRVYLVMLDLGIERSHLQVEQLRRLHLMAARLKQGSPD